jgi:hypothetical protein
MVAKVIAMERKEIDSAQVAARLQGNKELSSGANPASYTRNNDAGAAQCLREDHSGFARGLLGTVARRPSLP